MRESHSGHFSVPYALEGVSYTAMSEKNNSTASRGNYRKLEDVVGCKWSVSVLQAVSQGINRPGALERHVAGISTKVLSERLRKLTQYGLLDKQVHAEVPPRTEYALTQDGRKLVAIISQIQSLDAALAQKENDDA